MRGVKKLSCGGKGPCCHIGYSHRHCEHCDMAIDRRSYFSYSPYYPTYPTYATITTGATSMLGAAHAHEAST